jgi:NhaA family Na+:H+ antiporter
VILVFDDLWQTLSHPVTLGVMLGLVVGKLVGIAGTSWLVVKLGWAKLPDQVTFQQIIGVGLLGGIGFTMAIFIAEIGFSGNELLILQAKIGILLASVLSGVIGYLFLRMQAPHQQTD